MIDYLFFSITVLTDEDDDPTKPETLNVGRVIEIRGVAASSAQAKKCSMAIKDVSCVLFLIQILSQ
jgi:hypothetical protein